MSDTHDHDGAFNKIPDFVSEHPEPPEQWAGLRQVIKVVHLTMPAVL